MGVDLCERRVINPDTDEQYKTILKNLQGNILKGHGRDHSIHVFLKFNEPISDEVRAYLAELANGKSQEEPPVITSALAQHRQSKKQKEGGGESEMFGNLFLTAKGYRTLGVSTAELEKAFPGAENYFLKGMTDPHSVEALNDPAKETWEDGYKDGQIDAMILLANKDREPLEAMVEELKGKLKDQVLFEEWGEVVRRGKQSFEHFGYVDGISQPIFLSTDPDLCRKNDQWNSVAPLDLVLVPDMLADDTNCFGSYLVFRKLEQEVRKFKIGRAELARKLKLMESKRHAFRHLPASRQPDEVRKAIAAPTPTESDWEYVGAMMVGRFEDGTPLTGSQKAKGLPQGDEPLENNFTHDGDEGLRCPVFAHIRSTTPRTKDTERFPLIARRGVPYGERESLDVLPAGPVGLLFMCFQKSIKDQFVSIQQRANEDLDPIIGQSPQASQHPRQWPVQWGHESIPLSFNTSWVRLKGGEFFFAPSIPFLKKL